jgi:Flp pilus assembly protein TadD
MMHHQDTAPDSLDTGTLFHRGLAALNAGYPASAMGYFGAAVSTESTAETSPLNFRALSYYGLSLALAEGPSAEAVEACERAAARGGSDPDLCANLGWVYLLAGRRTTALSALDCARELGWGCQLGPGSPTPIGDARPS